MTNSRWGWHSFFWLLPILYGLAATTVLCTVFIKPEIITNKILFRFVTPYCIAAPFGGWWAIYQCLRYEKRPWRYAAIVVFVPAGFVWYYFERYRIRQIHFWRDQERNESSAN
jgi:hypothetical protein